MRYWSWWRFGDLAMRRVVAVHAAQRIAEGEAFDVCSGQCQRIGCITQPRAQPRVEPTVMATVKRLNCKLR